MLDATTAGQFASDDGSVPGEVADVLAGRAAGRVGLRELVRVLAGHRLLVPLLEVDGDLLDSDDADPCAGQDRAVAAVSLRTDAGPIGLAFTGLAPMSRWKPAARPMPVTASRVAAAVLAEGGVALLVDPGAETGCRIEGRALEWLARDGRSPEPWADPEVQRAVLAELGPALSAGELALRLAPPDSVPDDRNRARPGPEPDGGAATGAGDDLLDSLLIELRFPASVSPGLAQQRAGLVAERLARSAGLREVFDGLLAVRVV